VEAVEEMTGDWLCWVTRAFGERFSNDVAWAWGTWGFLSLEEAAQIVARDHGYVIGDNESLERLARRIEMAEDRDERLAQRELAHGF